jgi:hypothetical protein
MSGDFERIAGYAEVILILDLPLLPADNSEVDPALRTEGVVLMLWPITYRSSAAHVRDNDHPGL